MSGGWFCGGLFKEIFPETESDRPKSEQIAHREGVESVVEFEHLLEIGKSMVVAQPDLEAATQLNPHLEACTPLLLFLIAREGSFAVAENFGFGKKHSFAAVNRLRGVAGLSEKAVTEIGTGFGIKAHIGGEVELATDAERNIEVTGVALANAQTGLRADNGRCDEPAVVPTLLPQSDSGFRIPAFAQLRQGHFDLRSKGDAGFQIGIGRAVESCAGFDTKLKLLCRGGDAAEKGEQKKKKCFFH